MRLYALVEAGDPEAIDVYLREEDAQRALEDCLRDEPEWRGLLRVEEVEFACASRRRTSTALVRRVDFSIDHTVGIADARESAIPETDVGYASPVLRRRRTRVPRRIERVDAL
jgi:hypothetical protein